METYTVEGKENKISIVTKVICEYFGVSKEQLYSKDKTTAVLKARSFAMYILHKDMRLTAPCIAEEFGRRRRAVFYACENIKDYLKFYNEYRDDYKMLSERLGRL